MKIKILSLIVSISLVLGQVPPATAAVTVPWDPFFANPVNAADLGANTRPFGIAAGDFDSDGKIQYVNPAIETITGYSPNEMIGRHGRVPDARQALAILRVFKHQRAHKEFAHHSS